MFLFLMFGTMIGCYIYTFQKDFDDDDKGVITLTAVILLLIVFMLSIL